MTVWHYTSSKCTNTNINHRTCILCESVQYTQINVRVAYAVYILRIYFSHIHDIVHNACNNTLFVNILNLYLLQQKKRNNNKYDLQNNQIYFFLSSLTFFHITLLIRICVRFVHFNIRTSNGHIFIDNLFFFCWEYWTHTNYNANNAQCSPVIYFLIFAKMILSIVFKRTGFHHLLTTWTLVAR